MPDKIKILYDAVSKDYNVGSFDEFQVKLQDDTKRKAFYDGVGAEYDLGDFNSFTDKVKKKVGTQPVSSVGTQTSNRGFEPFQSQADTKTPSVLTPKGQTEYQEQVNGYKPQPIVQQAQPKEEKPDFLESIKNSLTNIGVGVQEFIPNTQIALSSTLEGLLGKDLGSDFYRNIVGSTHNPELDRQESYAKLAELEPQFKKTRGLIESAESFDVPGLAAATVDAMSSLVRTAITSIPTAGVGLASDMVGGSIASYNQEKAKSKGISVDELYKRGENEFVVPATIGAIGTGLEAIGLKGTIGLINKKLTGSFAKKFATTFVDVNKEGLTEFLQTGLDASNKALAEGKNVTDAGKVAVDEMFSKKGLESYLMGVVGSSGASGVGRVLKGMLPANKKKAEEATLKIAEMESELSNLNLSPATQNFIAENIQQNVSQIADAVENDASEVEGLSDEQKFTINSVNEIINSYEEVLSDPNASEQTKKLAQERINGLDLEIDNILNGKKLSKETESLIQQEVPQVANPSFDTEEQIISEGQQSPKAEIVEKPKIVVNANLNDEGQILAGYRGIDRNAIETPIDQRDNIDIKNYGRTVVLDKDVNSLGDTDVHIGAPIKAGRGGIAQYEISIPKGSNATVDGLVEIIKNEHNKNGNPTKSDIEKTMDLLEGYLTKKVQPPTEETVEAIKPQEDAVNQGNIEQSNITEREGVTEQQQREQEDRKDQEKPITESQTTPSNRNQSVEGRKVEEKVVPKEKDTVSLPPRIKGGLQENFEFNEGEWKQRVGKELVEISKNQQKQVNDAFVGENVAQEVKPTESQFKQFKDIVNESKTLDEAFEKVREIKGVPKEVADAFAEKYSQGKELSPKQAFEKFYNEVKGLKPAEKLREEGERVQEVDALKDVEATAKALEVVENKIISKLIDFILVPIKAMRRDKGERQKKDLTWYAIDESYLPPLEKPIKPVFEVVEETDNEFVYTENGVKYEVDNRSTFEKIKQEALNNYNEKINIQDNYYVLSPNNVFDIKNKEHFDKLKSYLINKIGENKANSFLEDAFGSSDFNESLTDDVFESGMGIEMVTESSNPYKGIGFDAIKFKEGGKRIVAIFDPNKVKFGRDVISEAYHKAKADGTNPELVKAVEELLGKKADERKTEEVKRPIEAPRVAERKGEVETAREEAKEPKVGDILRSFADKIENGKINKLGGFRASTGFDSVWDGSLTVVAESLRTGAKLADAIESGLKYIRKTDWYKGLADKEDFERQYRNHFNKEYESLSVEEKPDEGSRAKRMTTQRVLSGTYRKAFKDAMTENAIYYKQLPNDLTTEEAQTIIDIKGIGESEALIFDMNNTLSLPVRFTIAQKLIDNYESSGETLKAVDIYERIVEKITDTAQGLQSLTNWPKLSKASQVAMAKKNIEVQRNELKKKSQKTTNKIDKEFKKANKEAAEETVKKIAKIIDANTKLAGEGSITDLPIGYGVKNKVFTRDRYLKAKNKLRGMALSGVPVAELVDIAGYHIEATGRDFARFSRRMKADVGSKIKPFLKDLYGQARESLIKEGYDKSLFLTDEEVDANINEQNGQIWKEKLEKAIAKGDAKAQKVAIQKLQEISKDEGVWGQYKESAAKKLKGIVLTNVEKDISGNPSLQQFTDGLVKNMRQKMTELLPEQAAKKNVARPSIEIIGDAYKNLEKYKEVWEQTQKEFQEKYADQPEVLQAIDDYFGEILDKPFSDKLIESAVKQGLKELGKNIGDLVVQHYTVLDNAGQTLAEKLVNDAGLSGVEATELANAVQEEFSKIATKKKEAILERIFSKKERKKPAIKGLESEIVKLTNLGAFRTDEIVEAYADKMGFPKLTEENIKEIERLSDVVEKTTDPIKKRRAVEDLLAYQAKIKGISITELVTAIWYANVLSGYNTQIVNFGANAINTALLFSNAIAQRPKDIRFIAKGLVQGIKRGLLEGKETFKTGYSPIKGKAEIPQILEREDFRNYYLFKKSKLPIAGSYINLLKYVRRTMVAADVIFFEGLKEMRAYQSAMMQASKEMKDRPSDEQWNRAIELVGASDRQLEIIKNQAELEYQEAVNEINESDVTNEQKKKLIEQANRDKGRRIFDLIEQQRSSDIIQETAEYAAEGTYNYKPKGALGAFANAINTMVQFVPAFRIIVPFTNIIANVANETINYTPLAFARLQKGGWTSFRREELTDRQRADLITKGAIGTVAMAIVFAMTQIKDEDDEPLLEITANGAGDFAKNATIQETGWQPYSFRVKLPNGEYTGWISYQYSPLIASLGFIGHVNDLMKYKDIDDEETMYSLMSKSAGLTVNTFFQATFLEGLNDFLSGLFDPRASQSLWEKTVKASIQTAKGVVLPNMISQLSRGMESVFGAYKKETRDNLLGSVLQDIPVARDFLYNKINILGEPISSDTDKFLSFNRPNKYIQLLIDKKAVFAPINRKAEKIYDIELGKERILTDEEFYDYSRDKGQYIKQALEINYDRFNKMTPYEFRKELKSIKQDATESARYSIADLGTKLIEIEKNVDGEKKIYKLNPEQAKIAKDLMDKRLKSSDMSIVRKDLVNLYTTIKKMTKEKAEREADIKINKIATKYAQNEIWLKHLEGKDKKYILELK